MTKGGTDPLLSVEENTADLVEPPTEEEMNTAITGNLSNLLVVVSWQTSTVSIDTDIAADESSEEV